jgi:hypothetical protein
MVIICDIVSSSPAVKFNPPLKFEILEDADIKLTDKIGEGFYHTENGSDCEGGLPAEWMSFLLSCFSPQ